MPAKRFYNLQVKLRPMEDMKVKGDTEGKVLRCTVDLMSPAYKAFGVALTELLLAHDEAIRVFYEDGREIRETEAEL